jgi:GT2 family glycosyltransferase
VSLRVRQLGYRLVYDPEAAVEHLVTRGGSRVGDDTAAYAYGWHHNNAYFYSKHFAPRALAGFLRIHIGHLIARMILSARQFHLLGPSLRGLVDGYRAGARKRRIEARRSRIDEAGGRHG